LWQAVFYFLISLWLCGARGAWCGVVASTIKYFAALSPRARSVIIFTCGFCRFLFCARRARTHMSVSTCVGCQRSAHLPLLHSQINNNKPFSLCALRAWCVWCVAPESALFSRDAECKCAARAILPRSLVTLRASERESSSSSITPVHPRPPNSPLFAANRHLQQGAFFATPKMTTR
jgi:hypothetical protein